MIIIEMIVSLALLAGVVVAIAVLQCVRLYVRRSWQARLRIPDPAVYTDAPSFRYDCEIAVRIHSTQPVHLRFLRCGSDRFHAVYEVNADAMAQPARIDHWRGCDWKPTVVIPPNTLPPGFYQVIAEHEDGSSCWRMCLLVQPVLAEPVVVVEPTNTWNAYNDLGGLSNYSDHATPQPLRSLRAIMRWFNLNPRIGSRHWLCAVPLPERRPNLYLHRKLSDDLGEIAHIQGEHALIRFLEREHIPYMVISDRDFAYNLSVSRTRLLIFNTHSEYWSNEMMARLRMNVKRGISVLVLSGDNIYRKVQFMDAATSVIEQMISAAEVASLIGTYSDSYGYNTYAAYRVSDASHWCFKGLGLQEGSEFGAAAGRQPGASGGETDKLLPIPTGFQVVAIGTNVEGPAFMVCRDMPEGSFIFSVSSTAFTRRLDDDEVIQGLVRNLITRGIMEENVVSLTPGARSTWPSAGAEGRAPGSMLEHRRGNATT